MSCYKCILNLFSHYLQGEGIAYRGRILIWLDCIEGEPDDTGLVSVEDCDPLPAVSTYTRPVLPVPISLEIVVVYNTRLSIYISLLMNFHCIVLF